MSTAPDVLFVEDNEGDVALLRTAFDEVWPGVILHTVSTADEAVDFILRRGRHAAAPHLSLVLLDLNLPIHSGHTVLERVSDHLKRQRLPVVAFSSSCRSSEIEQCYKLGASLYVVKPNHWNGYVDLAASFAKLAALSG